MSSRVTAYALTDDGLVPNNPILPLLVYGGAIPGSADAAPQRILARFAGHGWGGGWVNGIYPFHHYHATAHEVLGIAAGWAKVQFGGATGPVLAVAAGDVIVIPAGVGHCRTAASDDLAVVGAYPRGQEAVDLRRATAADRAGASALIHAVALPARDPVHGREGPLFVHWRLPQPD